jgi:predicted nucleotide-binding protein
VAHGRELLEKPVQSEADYELVKNDYRSWDEFNATLLRRSFSSPKPADAYASWPHAVVVGRGTPLLHQRIAELHQDINTKLRRIESLRGQLELYDENFVQLASTDAERSVAAGNDIFIVHGHETAVREAAARFITAATTSTPVILHEQANEGRTIIEKFEDYAPQAGFAVVLLTSDDVGRSKQEAEDRPRARQNVVFELGFFVGVLGRSRVAVLYEQGVELPSDMSGVLYTAIDDRGAWKMELAREMRAAGLEVDLNQAI